MITPDHEILTQQNGWIPVGNTTANDFIATINIATGKLEYQKPSEVQSEELDSADLFAIRHNRVELNCKPSTKVFGKMTKTSAWQKLTLNNCKSLDFTMRLYLGEVVVKPINMKVHPSAYTGSVYSLITANGNFMVRKNDKIFLVSN